MRARAPLAVHIFRFTMTQLEKLQATGIRRVGTMQRGFDYRDRQGKPVSQRVRAYIEALKIPPAWNEVAINPSPKARLVAIGRDKAGRWQYRYHPTFVKRQEEQKYDRLLRFAEALPRMRAAIARDLALPGLGREKVLACVLQILATCFIRPGSQVYADENGSFGLATLRNEHVTVKGDRVEFHFRGKSGKEQHRELTDRRVARLVRELLRVPGKENELFKWRNADGSTTDVRRRHINEYIKGAMGEEFSAKDFRTWAGTLACACALARAGADDTESAAARKRKVVAAVKETAQLLGNTPAICRASYIIPTVLSSFERGVVVERSFDTLEELVEHRLPRLHASERALLELLRAEAIGASPREKQQRLAEVKSLDEARRVAGRVAGRGARRAPAPERRLAAMRRRAK